MSRSRWLVAAVAIAIAAAATACTPSAPGSTAPENSMAGQLVDKINADRSARGIPTLVWDQQLTVTAYEWSKAMSFYNNLVHRNLKDLLNDPAYNAWDLLAENIFTGNPGSAFTSADIHGAFMNSSGHRTNILNPAFNAVGVGVYYAPDGKVWVTENFGHRN